MERGNQPIIILPEGTQRERGRDAQRNNILAAKLVAETVRTTLGPKGMDKMLVDSAGDITVTNDGVTILERMDISHPAAKMVVQIARTQEDEVGDGTTTAVILAGELLKKAEKLLDDKIHPTIIIKGYRAAQEHAEKELQKLSERITIDDTEKLEQIAQTAMTGKGAESAKDKLAQLAVKAIRQVDQEGGPDLSSIKIEHHTGASAKESQLIEGIVLDKERVHPRMPTSIREAKILLLDSPIELKETEASTNISITDPSQMQTYLDMEEKMLDRIVQQVKATGANAVFCQKGVDDLAAYQLAKRGIVAIRRVKKSDMETLSKATGAKIISDLKDADEEHLGKAGSITQKKVGDRQMTFLEGCAGARAVTILVRGATEHLTNEITRAVTDAVGDLRAAIKNGKIVAGAGAIEMELSKSVGDFAKQHSGREQLAIQAYAEAMEIIPRTLAENAGLDPISVITDLKNAHGTKRWAGIDVFTGKVMDAWKKGVVEPLQIKTQAISSATDVAAMILRIDDVISSGQQASAEPLEL